MRGEFAAIARSRVAVAHLPLISQRAGPLTASPEGEAFSLHKKAGAISRPLPNYNLISLLAA